MAYPTTLDNFTEQVNGEVILANDINELQTAIESLEAKVGIDSSANNATVDYKLSGVGSGDKAASLTGTETLPNKTLTSPKITVGSDAVGDIHYTSNVNGTQSRLGIGSNGQILKVSAGALSWAAEVTTVDASTTAKGVVEIATSSEVTAGTATGGTGAALVVTPDALAASTPVFSGLGLTNTVRVSRLAGYSPAANTTENTVWSTTITGNTLSANGIIKSVTPISFTTNATAETWTIRLKFGGSTLSTITVSSSAVGGGTATTAIGEIKTFIANNAATNSQNVGFYINLAGQFSTDPANDVMPTSAHAADTTSAIDTTSNQTLTITVQRTNGAGGSGTFSQTLLETIKNA